MHTVPRSEERPVVDAQHLNSVIQAVTWVLLAITTLALIFRLLTRFYLREKRDFGWEDALIILSYSFGLGQSVTFLSPKSKALGIAFTETTPQLLQSTLKAQYAGNLLFVASLFFAKASVCASFLTLSPFHKRTIYFVGGGLLLWVVTSIFSFAFQCQPSRPWDYMNAECGDRAAISRYVIVTNIITDMSLILFPIIVIIPLKMPSQKRAAILSLFAVRVLAVAASMAQLLYVNRQFTDDFTLAIFPYVICTQIVQCASISTACLAYIWPLLKSLQSGLIWADNAAPSIRSPISSHRKWLPGTYGSHASEASQKEEPRKKYIEIPLHGPNVLHAAEHNENVSGGSLGSGWRMQCVV